MSLDLGQLFLKLKVDEKGFNAGLSAAEKRSKTFRVAATAAFLAVGVAAVKFGADSLRAYGEAEAAQQKLTFAFQRFPKLADTNISALRRLNSEQQKKTRFDDDATAAAQAQLAQFKLTGQQIQQLTPLLHDYAARTGKDLPAAANDLGRAVLGQGRALKSVGLNLKDTGSQTGNLEQLMKGLRTQVGGFAEIEGKSAAGRVEILKNQFGELQEQAGANLAPALSKVVGILTSLVMAVGENAEVIGPLAAGVAGLTGVIWLSHKAVKAYTVAHGLMNTAMASNSKVIAGVASKLGPLGIAIGAGATLLGVFATQQKKAEMEARGFTDSLTFQNGVLDDNSAQMLAKKLADEGALEAARAAGVSEGDYVRALLEGGVARDQMIQKLDATAMSARASADALEGDIGAHLDTAASADKAADKLVLMGGGLDASKRAAELAASAIKGSTTATDKQGKSAEDAKKELQEFANSMFEATEASLALSGAEISVEQAFDDAKRAVKDNGKTLDITTQKGRDNKNALRNLVTVNQDYIAKLVETGKGSKRVQGATKNAKEEFIKVAEKMGVGSKRAKELADRYYKIPKGVKTKVEQPGMPAALTDTGKLRTSINKIDGRKVKITYSSNAEMFAKSFKLGLTLNSGERNAAGGARGGIVGPGGGIVGRARGGVLAGNTPLSQGDDVPFPMAQGGIQPLRGGEGIYVTEAMRDPYERARLYAVNKAALRGERLQQFRGMAAGGVISVGTDTKGLGLPNFDTLTNRIANRLGDQIGAGIGKKLDAAKRATGGPGGPVGSGGYAKALSYARAHEGHPYQFGTLWDCSGFLSALHSIILGQSPHRRYSTTAFRGPYSVGFTRGKRSPFMVGVDPRPGKFGHMAGTLNGVNVESAGGVGVRVGGGARGHGFGSWHGGLAGGGVVGDLPFDLLDPAGQRYDPKLRALFEQMRNAGALATGSRSARPGFNWTAEKGGEFVVNPQLRKYDGGERVFDHKDTKRLLRGGDWKDSPAIGEVNFTMPASMDPVAAANLAGGLLVAKLSAKGIGR